MHLLMLALLATVTVNEVTFDTDIIENTEDQWIAPGYRIAEELILDPGDYGTPILLSNSNYAIGFQPLFVDTYDGEKWRIVLAFEGEIVVLQEDSETRRFSITGDIEYMMNSADGRFVLLGLREEDPEPSIWLNPLTQPVNRVVLLDIETGDQSTTSGIRGAGLVGNDGSVVIINDDVIEFYDEALNSIETVSNCIRELGGTATGYASDGSMLVRVHSDDYADPDTFILRAYDRYGNVLGVTDNQNYGYPIVSEHGEYVFVLQLEIILCLDGSDGSVLWEQPHESEIYALSSSRKGAACAFETDLSLSDARQNSIQNRHLYIVNTDEYDNAIITNIAYQSDQIGFSIPEVVNSNGCLLLKLFFGERPVDLSTFMYCIFNSNGRLIYERMISTTDHSYVNIWANLPRSLVPVAIDSAGIRVIWWDNKDIHILVIEEEGFSE